MYLLWCEDLVQHHHNQEEVLTKILELSLSVICFYVQDSTCYPVQSILSCNDLIVGDFQFSI
jgi:hypothetical protein